MAFKVQIRNRTTSGQVDKCLVCEDIRIQIRDQLVRGVRDEQFQILLTDQQTDLERQFATGALNWIFMSA